MKTTLRINADYHGHIKGFAKGFVRDGSRRWIARSRHGKSYIVTSLSRYYCYGWSFTFGLHSAAYVKNKQDRT